MENKGEQKGGYVRGLYTLALLYTKAAKTGIGDSRDLTKDEIDTGVRNFAEEYAKPKK